jgi:hypothetical protein
MDPIQCKTCNAGWFVRQKVRRLSGPTVAIDYNRRKQ